MLTRLQEQCEQSRPSLLFEADIRLNCPRRIKGMGRGWGAEWGEGKAGGCLTCDKLNKDAAYAPDVSLKAPAQAKDDFRRPVVPGGHNGAVILL